jgi:hypothetical protein
MCGIGTDDTPVLLPTHFIGAAQLFVMEHPLANFLLDLRVAHRIFYIIGRVNVLAPPVGYKLSLVIEVGAAKVAAAWLTAVREARPLVPRTTDDVARDVRLTLPELAPCPDARKRILPYGDVCIAQLASS